MDEIQCNGTEESIADCMPASIGTNNCRHFENVVVRCCMGTVGELQLRGGGMATSGRIEVLTELHEGLCVMTIGLPMMQSVACRELGFSTDGMLLLCTVQRAL